MTWRTFLLDRRTALGPALTVRVRDIPRTDPAARTVLAGRAAAGWTPVRADRAPGTLRFERAARHPLTAPARPERTAS